MAVHSIKAIQRLPISIEKAWEFYSDPANLQSITPADMGFKVTSFDNIRDIYAGQIIEYKVRPLFGIPIYWMTEITHVKELEYFVDEQRFGPYSLWHHQHHFKKIEGGVEMTDLVHYKIPLGFLGEIANGLFVKNKLKNIFEFRWTAVENMFGKMGDSTSKIEMK